MTSSTPTAVCPIAVSTVCGGASGRSSPWKPAERVEELRADRELAVLRRELPAHAAELLVRLRQRLLIQLAAARLAEAQRLGARLDLLDELLHRLRRPAPA